MERVNVPTVTIEPSARAGEESLAAPAAMAIMLEPDPQLRRLLRRVLPSDGFNLVLHEFAHYLDAEGGSLAPTLPQAEHAHGGRASARGLNAWSTDLAEEFDRTLAAVERGALTFLDPYAAEDEAEFFAVATEEFYVRPRELRAAHQRLYRLLREFYGVDPAGWLNCR